MGRCPFTLLDMDTAHECSVDSGYSFWVISSTPTPDQIKKMCASSNCQRAISTIKSTQPSECNTGGPTWDFMLYGQILNPIAAGCAGGAAPPPPPPPPPPSTPVTAPPTTAPAPPPATPAPPPPTTPPSAPTTSAPPQTATPPPAPGGGGSSETTSPATTGGTSAGATPTDTANGASGTTNATWTTVPSAGTAPGTISSAKNSTGASTINTSTTESSGSSNSTVIIAIVAGVVVVIALVAFLAFRAGKRKNDNRSPREQSYVNVDNGKQTRYNAEPRNHSNAPPYRESPVLHTTTSSAPPVSRSSAVRSPALPSGSNPSAGSSVVSMNATANSLANDSAILKARIRLEDIYIPTGPSGIVNQGAFGEVLRGSYNGEVVAVKRLLPARRKDMKEIETFLEEAKLLTSLRHQRIVQFIGVAWDSLAEICIVSEFMEGGDLRALLAHADANNEPTGFDANKVKIALHIIHALSYLHGLKPIIVHRDLKSKNVLLTRDLDAKLTDFGVSREQAEKTMTAGVGSSLWMAPEVMLGERYDEKADIFSFGVVLSELDTQKLPYSHAKEPGSDRKIPEMAMLKLVSAGQLTVEFSDGADEDMVATGRACVAVDPKQRPSASEVLRRMHHIYRGYRQV